MKFSENSFSKGERFKMFMKRYGYIFGIVIAAVAVATVALVAAFVGGGGNAVITPPGGETGGSKVEWVLPVANAEIIKDYNGSKLVWNETLEQFEAHKAIDFKLNSGDSVFAVLDGRVISVYSNMLEGTVVIIEHSNNMKTVYKSLNKDKLVVKIGDTVKTGARIGEANTSAGNESKQGIHLHFEMLKLDKAVDPALYLNLGDK